MPVSKYYILSTNVDVAVKVQHKGVWKEPKSGEDYELHLRNLVHHWTRVERKTRYGSVVTKVCDVQTLPDTVR